jgi:hypothetical protein
MKRNRVAIALVLILGITSAVLIMYNTNSTIRPELKDFAIRDTSAITKIHLKDKANKEVTLEKVPGGKWKLNGKYYARQDAVQTLLYTMMAIKVRNPVGKRAMENVIKQLASGSTKVDIYEGDKLVKSYYVGGETQDDEGTYMLMVDAETGQNSSAPFVLSIPGFNGYVSGRYFTSEKDWRDKTVFNYHWSDIKSIQVEYSEKKEASFTLNVNSENSFEVLDAAGNKLSNLDTAKIRSYIGYYYNIQYEGIETIRPSEKDSVMRQGWVHAITVTGVDGKKTTLRTYHKPPPSEGMTDNEGKPLNEDMDRMFAVMNDNKDEVLVVQFYVFGKLFMPSSHFVKKSGNK